MGLLEIRSTTPQLFSPHIEFLFSVFVQFLYHVSRASGGFTHGSATMLNDADDSQWFATTMKHSRVQGKYDVNKDTVSNCVIQLCV